MASVCLPPLDLDVCPRHSVRYCDVHQVAMNTQKRPILLVDDDHDIREALTDTLQDQGFDVLSAGNGLEALRLLRSTPVSPSVILLDLMMPVMDGYGFLDEQRRDPALAAIPVAIITASHAPDVSRLGAAPPVVPKPIKVPQLINLLRKLEAGNAQREA